MEIKDIEQLAALARIELSDTEKTSLLKDFQNILAFVDEVKKADVSLDTEGRVGVLKNVMREDENPHESGIFTDVLLAEAPATKDGYVKVKNIL